MENGKSKNSADSAEISKANSESKCPFHGAASNQSANGGRKNVDWWPNKLNLNILR